MALAYLDRLNQKQKEAVVCKAPHVQILAGPGSGKTRVLTARVAHLIRHHKVSPSSIMVATFTRKAAKDMRERLEKDELLGPDLANNVNMGTFHSLCAYYLRIHPSVVHLPQNFRIIDPQEGVKVLEKLIEERQGSISSQTRATIKSFKGIAEEFQAAISKAKNEGFTAKTYGDRYMDSLDPLTHDIILVFNAYQQRLALEHLLDFDDLLLYGRDLFEAFPDAAVGISHILVDEFQDTNKVQYHIVHSLCTKKKHLTIVGDPDQSIYGFRNANIANFKMMINDFKGTRVVHLEENYRSTSSILNGALHIIQKDPERIEKGLFTKNSPGTPISLMHCETELDESQKVVNEIIRIIEYSHGLLKYKDIAVLVRMHYLTQNVESAFKASSIPYEIVGGTRFFERTEIRDLVGYVHFSFNPNDTLSFETIINTPRRGVGDSLVEKISTLSRAHGKTVLDILDGLCRQDLTLGYALPEKVLASLRNFIQLCTQVKTMMDSQAPVEAILNYIIRTTDYENYLARTYSNHEIRWENVGELISVAHSHDTKVIDDNGIERLVGDLGAFIERTTLDLDIGDSSQGDKDRVQVMTIHAAKGLEWPCVFLIACEDAIIPHVKAKNVNEERRLLYVAMTRAKCFLYNTYVHKRVSWGEAKRAFLSPFLTEMETTMYERRTPAWNKESRAWVASVLHLSTLQIDTMVDDVLDHGGDDLADYALLSSQQTLALLTNGRKRVYESDEFDDDDFDCDVFDDYYSDFEFGYDSDFGISDNDNPSQACSVDGNLHDS